MSEFLILDLKRKFIGKKFFPFRMKNIALYHPYAIRNKKIYQLMAQEDFGADAEVFFNGVSFNINIPWEGIFSLIGVCVVFRF